MKILLVFLVLCLISLGSIHAQKVNDTLKNNTALWKQFIVPAGLTGGALLLNNSRFEKDLQLRLNSNANTSIDDYTRFAPVAQMYITDIAGVQSRSHWFDQTKNLGISLLLIDLVTTQLKKNIEKDRPSGDNSNAFPSAHSAYAFTTATVLYQEFKDTSPILAYSGYGFAVATAGLRVAKNAHFVSDVLLGAGIGMGIVKLVYLLDHLYAWNPFLKNDNIVIVPSVGNQTYGLAGIINF
ncbi:phosphatase PAP2 family protein [Nonlabens antarcticus]|uniref:phosphatase PAP2 family protein n=1 Tax=Nonlabens antarcticus TaxID=392714 RepID=UPI001891804A|nr:phosphatase PAP2 family protein [Nonlabens antarcticus]